jgi:hypothetical protein
MKPQQITILQSLGREGKRKEGEGKERAREREGRWKGSTTEERRTEGRVEGREGGG